MILFSAYMYNVTSEEWLGPQPEYCSLGYYFGSDLVVGTDEGTIKSVPRADITYNVGNNIGVYFEQYAKGYYRDNAEYPVLRLYKTKTEKSYIEWNPINPDSLLIHTEHGEFTWSHVFYWEQDPLTFAKPCIFVSTEIIGDLVPENVIWSGSVQDSSNENVNLYLSYTNAVIYTDPNRFVEVHKGDYICHMVNDNRTWVADGLALACFIKSTSVLCGPVLLCPAENVNPYPIIKPYNGYILCNNVLLGPNDVYVSNNKYYRTTAQWWTVYTSNDDSAVPIHECPNNVSIRDFFQNLLDGTVVSYGYMQSYLYEYLTDDSQPPAPPPVEPPSDVDPDDIPPTDEPPTPIEPDNPDPYYDPTSDPDNPDYDPGKDPDSPDYDPDVPHTPFRPTTDDSPTPNPDPLPPVNNIVVPPAPPAYVTNNRLLTFYNPVDSELNDLATFLWSPTWSIDTFKKIFANPLDAILGLMVMPTVPATVSTRELTIGNIGTGVTMRYFTQQFVDVSCGSITIQEYYQSYLDYSPYTKIMLILPFIGECAINTDEVMGKTVDITYRFDIATGICVAFVSVDGCVLYTFNGSAVTTIPLSANGWGSAIGGLLSMPIKALGFGAATGTGPVGTLGAAAAISVASMKPDISHTGNITGSAGLMGIQKPYIIINRPRQALPMNQNSYTGYPSFITESLGGLNGYTEVEKCHLEHVPATADELNEIERLLKEGVLL